MRLSDEEVRAIKAAGTHAFGADAVIRLFGSRVDDQRRGGDIDLHVEVAPGTDEVAARLRFERYLFARIEEQKVDVILHARDDTPSGIDVIAHRDGVVL